MESPLFWRSPLLNELQLPTMTPTLAEFVALLEEKPRTIPTWLIKPISFFVF